MSSSDGDASILGRLKRVETLLDGDGQGIAERLTSLENRIFQLEQAIGQAETARVNENLVEERAPAPVINPQPTVQMAVSASPEPDENNPVASTPHPLPTTSSTVISQKKDSGDDYACCCEPNSRLHLQLKAFARKDIFKCMKFLPPKDEELHSIEEGTVGFVVVREFKIEPARQKSWWKAHAYIVKMAILQRRNEISNDIRREMRNLLAENPSIGSPRCKVPSLERILNLRNDVEAFQFLVDHIFECVIGRREWKDQKFRKEVKSMLSVSDEAFAIVILENAWDVLTAKAGKKVETKYTGRRSFGKDDGWSRSGLARFNMLYETVLVDRKKNPSVDGRVRDNLFQEYYDERMATNKRKMEEQAKIFQGIGDPTSWKQNKKRRAF